MARTDEQIIRLINRTRSTPVFVGQDDVTQDSDTLIELDTEGTAAEQIGDIFIFQYRRNHGGGFNNIMISVNGHTAHQVRVLSPTGSLRFWQVNDITRYAIYMVYRADGVWQLIGGTYRFSYPPFNFLTDVPDVLNTFEDDDVFLVGDVSGGAMRRGLFSRLKELFRPSAGKDGTVMIDDPSVYDFRGEGVSVSVVSGQARITIPPSVREVSSRPTGDSLNDNELVVQRDSDNFAEKAYIKSNRKRPFFQITPADLGDGHIGYATGGYTGLDDNYAVNSGGSTTYSDIAAISEQFRNVVMTDFARVGTYTVPNSIEGLGAYNGNLYRLEDVGANARVLGFNPADGTIIHTSSSASPSEAAARGFTVLNGIGYTYGSFRDRFYSYDIDNTTWTQLSTAVNLPEVRGLAHANGNVYVLYRNANSQYFVAQLNTSNGSLGTGQRLTGYESDDREQYTAGFTSVENGLYISTEMVLGAQVTHIYQVNPSNGNLTTVGEIDPTIANLEHLAQLDDYIYAWNDDADSIWRAEIAIGNRWVVIFPNNTSEVDDSDTKLRLYKQSGADEIELIRDTDITDAIVFASGYDDETGHTIAVGTNENPALYKADGTTLYEGSDEAIVTEMPIGMPKATARGPLIATSDELPTPSEGGYYDDVVWTLESDIPEGFELDADTARDHRLYVPRIPPENANGFEVVCEVDGVEFDTTVLPWGQGGLQADPTGGDEYSAGNLLAGISGQNPQKITVRYYQEDPFAAGEPEKAFIALHGNSDTLPSGVIVKVYLSGLFIEFETDLQIGV